LLINSILCFCICLPAYLPIQAFHIEHPLSYFLMWLGLSIGMHAIPSNHDATNLFSNAKKAAKSLNPLALLSFPLVVVIVIANVSRFFWGDLLYGMLLGIGVPQIIFSAI
jgi:hypothetical protein